MAARDPREPVLFDLEDGDSVSLIPWEFVVDKMDQVLGANIIPALSETNAALVSIRNKLKQLADDQPED